MIDVLRKIIEDKRDLPLLFKRNILKEYLQLIILSFIYSNSEFRELVFYGGSCLRHCFNVGRLSEDMDFVDIENRVDIKELAEKLKYFLKKRYNLKSEAKIQKFRIILKIPILYELNLAKKPESNFLFLKIEVYKEFDFCKGYKIEIIPVFKLGEAILVRSFDIQTLMSTKIRAILHRKWEKTTKNGRILARVKGRDYYDLMWYLEKDIVPNFKCIEGINDKEELKRRLLSIIGEIDSESIKYDLEGLIENKDLIEDLGNNIRKIIKALLEKW